MLSTLVLNLIDLMLLPFTGSFFKKVAGNEKIEKVVSLYPEDKFIKIRFWDAPFLEVEKMVTKSGSIVDLGCGEGIFTNFLAVSSPNRKILGIELDKSRIKKADKGLPNVEFKQGDATKESFPKADNIILFHLLHHLRIFADQEKVIWNCLKSLDKNGKLIIVEVDKKLSFKYLISFVVDCFIVPWVFEKRFYTPVLYRSKKEWLKLFDSLGVKCIVTNLEKDKPFTHLVFEISL